MVLIASWGSSVKEASTGYFYDLHMTRVHGGKTWMAPQVLLREDVRLLNLPSTNKFTILRLCLESIVFSEYRWQSSGQWRQGTHHTHVCG